mgnify:FL=1
MRCLAFLSALLASCTRSAPTTPEIMDQWSNTNFFTMTASSLEGELVDFSTWKGKTVLVVNTASECGYTPQYAGLESLWAKYREEGLVIAGFPSNEFGGQEPGDSTTIRKFCSQEYGVSFPMFAKVETAPGENQSPVYGFLGTQSGKLPGWNFGKHLVSSDGRTVQFFSTRTAPDDSELIAAIEAAIQQ